MIEGIKVINQKGIMPYSFFNVVFIDIQKYSERELSNIIAHEKVHIQERHWIDLLIIELLMVLFWVNPVVWLYERSIKQNHEYLADQGVLLAGYHPGQYQALLINQLMGVKVLGFAHNLNFSLNKKRMEMMKKEKSPGAHKMKLLLALPVVALLVFAFAKKEYLPVYQDANTLAPYETMGDNKTLDEPLQIWGKVLAMDKKPIEMAEFICQGKVLDFKSNSRGEFMIELPTGYSYKEHIIDVGNDSKLSGLKIMVESDGFEASTMLIDPEIPYNSREILLRKKIAVKGSIINNHAEPLDGVIVTDSKTGISSRTNSKGEFEIASAQGHILEIVKPEYRTIHYALVDLENKPIEVVMKKGDKLIKIEGKVLTNDRVPLTGANVIQKGTNNGTVVDENGEFKLDVPDNSQLVISFVGYKTVTRRVTSDFTNDGPFKVTYTLPKGVFNVKLPETGNEEKLIKGDVVEVTPPPPPPKKGNKDEVFTIVEDMPYFGEGGMYQLAQELKKETNWVMEKTKDRGIAVVGFTVSSNGSIVDPHIVSSANSKMLDASAVKIIQKLDYWRPGIQRGKKVPVDLTVPVKFE